MKKQLFLLMMMLLPMAVLADDSGSCGDNVTYIYVESTHTLTISGTGPMKDYKFNNIPWYNYYTEIVKAVVEEGVTSIGTWAFSYCRNITSITIPNSVTNIGDYAFESCSGLTSFTIPNSVTSIGRNAFDKCSGLTSITIPNSVTSIGERTFQGCDGLTSIIVKNGNAVYDSRDNCNAIIETSTNNLLSGCKCTVIPKSVTSIGNYAFAACIGLTSITIPSSVTSIGEGAFVSCIKLNSITIPNSVTSIGDYAFINCIKLPSITIGNSVTSIGYYGFKNCSSLMDIFCYAEYVPSTDATAFEDSNITNVTLHVPETSIDLYKAAEPWKNFKEVVGLTDSDPNPELKCAKPTITIVAGKLTFNCTTVGASFNACYSYNSGNIKGKELILAGTTTAHVSVYATKEGYQNSDVAEADVELCVGIQGDVNQDGVVSIADAVNVVNIIMKGETAAPAMDMPQE